MKKTLILFASLGFFLPLTASAACSPVSLGGTGVCTITSGGLIFGNGTSPISNTGSPTRAGDIAYWTGSVWTTLAGNNSGTQILQENSSGVPSWAAAGGTGTVTNIATTYPVLGGPITTTGTISLAFGTTTVNNWSALNTFANATTTLDSQGVTWFTSNTGAILSTGSGGLLQNTTVSSPLNFTGSTLSCPTCNTSSGSVSSIATTNGINGGTITTTGTLSLVSYISTSSAETATRVPFWTTTAGNPAQLSGGSAGFTWNATGALLTVTNASTTALSASGAFYSPITSAVLIADANKLTTAATTQTCTNQFVRAMSATYSATCATVSAGDVSLATLTATDATLTFSGSYNGSVNRTVGINLANANTWTALQTINNASSTNATFATFLTIPSSSSQTPTIAGQIAQDTTNDQLKVGDGSATAIFDPRRFLTFTYATTTAMIGTTTLSLGTAPTGLILTSAQCYTDTGTMNVQYKYGSGPTNVTSMFNASTTIGTVTFTGNNTPAASNALKVDIGTPASTPTQISCTLTATVAGT